MSMGLAGISTLLSFVFFILARIHPIRKAIGGFFAFGTQKCGPKAAFS
jgi:hypothetical protein